ncbi:Serine/threonine-protein phosphatase PGAM5, mitochondrial [Araneus ventricosus]|uniref:Serine/threonine-protein phosphatase PGAM5, mitochondrial n=1 Tax=Araneus ventricosus TaxID=182803 RepID=A0A4Y2D050_ARAVE|nr:Serine/threonine-protein phosphatase PGAM5, mitochondrial [Araneus ventricosus]
MLYLFWYFRRDYSSLVKASDENDQNKANEKKTSVMPTARRHIFLIRHGQYDTAAKNDSDRLLTALGKKQAELVGQRLKDLKFNYTKMIRSTMTRARETSDIIHKFFPDLPVENCDLLREGFPVQPEPPGKSWSVPDERYLKDGSRIEAAFRKHFHRADANQTADSYEIIVCHANVIRYFICSYCGWENKKSRFSSEPTKGDFRIILSAGGLLFEELEIDVVLTRKENKDPNSKHEEYEGLLKICMQHGSKKLGENNFNWSRNCTYEYEISTFLSPFAHNLAVYWTDDDFLVIQTRYLESPLIKESKVEELRKFRLIPIEVIDVLEPALNVPFLKQILKAIKKKSNDVCSYVSAATAVPEANDVLSLLTCIPLTEGKKIEIDFEELAAEAEAAGQSSQ